MYVSIWLSDQVSQRRFGKNNGVFWADLFEHFFKTLYKFDTSVMKPAIRMLLECYDAISEINSPNCVPWYHPPTKMH